MTKLNISAERARLAMTCMAKNDIRYYLNGILVEPRAEGGAFIAGTNGHHLIVVIDESGVCDEPTILRIGNDLMRRCAKPGLHTKNIQRLQLDEFRGKPALLLTDPVTGELPDYVQFDPIVHRKFPEWRNVVPDLRTLKRGHASAFNTDLLHAVTSVLKSNRYGIHAIPYQQPSDNPGTDAKPIVFHLVGHEYACLLLMPLRDMQKESIDGLVARWPAAAKKAPAAKEGVPA